MEDSGCVRKQCGANTRTDIGLRRIFGLFAMKQGRSSFMRRFEPVFRMQQTFRINNAGSDGVPAQNTQRADFGLDYNFPHNMRILTNYSRQFSPAGDVNIWETGIVYRFLMPAWKGR